ncbi:MAG: hypothetical protein N3H31_07720, partial [Candidatus Nezhaarchaeota archaeon]|nr:hypothetical protein [Candidatus Nezhaarchaeota archaeon]
MRIALLTNTISGPGGAEYLTIAMLNSLRGLPNVEVKILGREKSVDLYSLVNWLDISLAHAIIKGYDYIPKFPSGLYKLRNYDLVINTRANEVLLPAHVHYLHWVFSPYGIKDPEAIAYYRR